MLQGLGKAPSSSLRQETTELKLGTRTNPVSDRMDSKGVTKDKIPETKQIGTHDVQIRGSKFTLIDTPGFDDDNLSDSDILKLLVDWLASTYRSGRKLNGILYLHRITDARMRGSSLRNFKVLKELTGEDFHANVTLGTTCWSLVPSEIAIARENELSTSTSFWKTLISKGARLERIPETAIEARELIYQIASHDPIVLQTQRDIVDLGKSFSSLTVAKLIDTEFEELRKQHEAEVERRRKEAAAESARQELKRQEELRQIRERDARILREKDERISSYKTRQANCRRIHPIGNCDKCRVNALSRFTVTYRNMYPDFWEQRC